MQGFILSLWTTSTLVFHSSFWRNETLIWPCCLFLTVLGENAGSALPFPPLVCSVVTWRTQESQPGADGAYGICGNRVAFRSPGVWLEAELLWGFLSASAPLLTGTVSKCSSFTRSRHSAPLLIDPDVLGYFSHHSYSEMKNFGFFSRPSPWCAPFWEAALRPSSWMPLSV